MLFIMKMLKFVIYVPTDEMSADILTKSLDTIKHNKFMNKMRLLRVFHVEGDC